jgi:hypothetical protein
MVGIRAKLREVVGRNFLGYALSIIAGKFDGYSEAWSKSTFEAKSIKELMRLTEEFEEK